MPDETALPPARPVTQSGELGQEKGPISAYSPSPPSVTGGPVVLEVGDEEANQPTSDEEKPAKEQFRLSRSAGAALVTLSLLTALFGGSAGVLAATGRMNEDLAPQEIGHADGSELGALPIITQFKASPAYAKLQAAAAKAESARPEAPSASPSDSSDQRKPKDGADEMSSDGPGANPDGSDSSSGADGEKGSSSDKKKSKNEKKPKTVEEAFSTGCSTSSVDGLSRQIMAEARCIDSAAFAPVPERKNLVRTGHVFLFLEAPARDHLIRALDAHPDRQMTVNSALRTLPQQYLLSRWANAHQCGIELAALPGESNHETGLALDVREHGTWKPALEAEGFTWLGKSDPVHFEYRGVQTHTGLDVMAFQRLWNRNHPEDSIPINGAYAGQTQDRIRKAPAAGFSKGPSCAPHKATSTKSK